jgi:hypothetical protein
MDSHLIDPKLDQIPADELTEEERQARLHSAPRHGLSINDTVAYDANHSVGSRGVLTSDVKRGPDFDQNLDEAPIVLQDDPLDLDNK